ARSVAYEFGVDEAGRGPLAGPVVCAACYLPPGTALDEVTDSKKIKTEEAREAVYAALVATPGVRFAVAKSEPALIDDINILQATLAAMRLAADALCRKLSGKGDKRDGDVLSCESSDTPADDLDGDFLALVDGNHDPWKKRPVAGLVSRAIVGGDATVLSISAASVIAKVTRDRIMNDLDKQHPAYDFAKHKGYGTVAHRRAIIEIGWIPGVHRVSYDPVKSILAAERDDPPPPPSLKKGAKRQKRT
ncbi:hypothetical protein CTAYLR_003603, partial [Chrysophaeum taylorii]